MVKMDDERLESLIKKVDELKVKHERAVMSMDAQKKRLEIIEANLRAYSRALAQVKSEVKSEG